MAHKTSTDLFQHRSRNGFGLGILTAPVVPGFPGNPRPPFFKWPCFGAGSLNSLHFHLDFKAFQLGQFSMVPGCGYGKGAVDRSQVDVTIHCCRNNIVGAEFFQIGNTNQILSILIGCGAEVIPIFIAAGRSACDVGIKGVQQPAIRSAAIYHIPKNGTFFDAGNYADKGLFASLLHDNVSCQIHGLAGNQLDGRIFSLDVDLDFAGCKFIDSRSCIRQIGQGSANGPSPRRPVSARAAIAFLFFFRNFLSSCTGDSLSSPGILSNSCNISVIAPEPIAVDRSYPFFFSQNRNTKWFQPSTGAPLDTFPVSGPPSGQLGQIRLFVPVGDQQPVSRIRRRRNQKAA